MQDDSKRTAMGPRSGLVGVGPRSRLVLAVVVRFVVRASSARRTRTGSARKRTRPSERASPPTSRPAPEPYFAGDGQGAADAAGAEGLPYPPRSCRWRRSPASTPGCGAARRDPRAEHVDRLDRRQRPLLGFRGAHRGRVVRPPQDHLVAYKGQAYGRARTASAISASSTSPASPSLDGPRRRAFRPLDRPAGPGLRARPVRRNAAAYPGIKIGARGTRSATRPSRPRTASCRSAPTTASRPA